MKKIALFTFLILLISCDTVRKSTNTKNNIQENTTNTQAVSVGKTPKTISVVFAKEVKEVVSFLASDDLAGRETGTEGIEKAASFIESQFESYGLKPYFDSYRDNFKVSNMDAYNVVGLVEGNDATLKKEYIIIGAHYDHIGSSVGVDGDTVANGANDNAAGTSGVLALAKYFGKNKTNKRSLLFVTFSAEEKGLLGSKHLAERLKEDNFNLYTMINLEMIGVPFKDRDYEVFLSGYDLSNLAEKINGYSGSNLIGYSEVSKKYNLFKRSDNYPFYKAFEVPCHTVSSCDLSNFDFYHHVDDEIDKLDYPFMASLINKLVPVMEQMANTETKEIKMTDNN